MLDFKRNSIEIIAKRFDDMAFQKMMDFAKEQLKKTGGKDKE